MPGVWTRNFQLLLNFVNNYWQLMDLAARAELCGIRALEASRTERYGFKKQMASIFCSCCQNILSLGIDWSCSFFFSCKLRGELTSKALEVCYFPSVDFTPGAFLTYSTRGSTPERFRSKWREVASIALLPVCIHHHELSAHHILAISITGDTNINITEQNVTLRSFVFASLPTTSRSPRWFSW